MWLTTFVRMGDAGEDTGGRDHALVRVFSEPCLPALFSYSLRTFGRGEPRQQKRIHSKGPAKGRSMCFARKKTFLGTSSLYLAALQGGKKEQEQLPRRERLPHTYGVQQACRQRFSLQTDPRSTPRRRSTERWRNRSTGNHSPHRRFRRNLPRTVLDKTDEFTGGRAYSVSLEDFLKVLSNV